MMSRGARKGFKRLDTHEMADLSGNGRTKLDSGSEEDILDLTMEEHVVGRENSCCYSCCVWFSILYVGLLTILVLLLGAFSGYIMVSAWQIDQHSNSTSNAIHDELTKLRDEFSAHTKHTYHVLDGLQETVFDASTTSTALNVSVSATLTELMKKVEDIDKRLKKIESHPQGVLMEQIESVDHKMTILDSNMGTLNYSLDELNDMRSQMASMDSVLNSYDGKLKELSSTIGDTIHDNTDIQDSIQGFADRIQNFSKKLLNMDSRMNQSHTTMQRAMDMSASRFSDLQSLVENMNETMTEEMESLWTNLTGAESVVTDLRTDVDILITNLTSLSGTVHEMPAQREEVPSTTPPPTTSHPSNETSSAETASATPEDMATETSTSTVAVSTIKAAPAHARIADEMDTATDSLPDTPGGHEPINTDSETIESPPGGNDIVTTGEIDTTGEIVTTDDEIVTTSEAGGATVGPDEGADDNGDDADEDSQQGSSSRLVAGIQKLENLYDNFVKWDLDGNGVLTQQEFTRYIDRPNIFSILDKDDDGAVDGREIQQALDILRNKNRGSAAGTS